MPMRRMRLESPSPIRTSNQYIYFSFFLKKKNIHTQKKIYYNTKNKNERTNQRLEAQVGLEPSRRYHFPYTM